MEQYFNKSFLLGSLVTIYIVWVFAYIFTKDLSNKSPIFWINLFIILVIKVIPIVLIYMFIKF